VDLERVPFSLVRIIEELTHSWSWALLEKLPIVKLLKNFPAFYGTRRFFTVFTNALNWSLSWTSSIESLEWKSSGSGLENRDLTAVGIRCADHAAPSIRKSRY
jgi:hypothetical protein